MMKYIATSVYLVLDALILYFLLFASGYMDNALIPLLHNKPVSQDVINSLWWFPLIYLIIFVYKGLYTIHVPFDTQLKLLVSSMILATAFAVILIFFNKSWEIARLLIIIYLVSTIIFFPIVKYIYISLLTKFNLFKKNLLIIGAGTGSSLLIDILNKNPTMGYNIIGILDDDKSKIGTSLQGYKILGPISKIKRFNLKNSDVIIAIPTLNRHQLLTLLSICQKKADNVKIMPDFTGIPVNLVSIEEFFDGQTILLNIKNNLKSKSNLLIKRVFDIIVSLILLPAILLLLIVLSIAITIESRGNPIFSGMRLGKNGKLFKCYKFRSMFVYGDILLEEYLTKNPDAKNEWEVYKKLREFDPRVTKVGKIMRKTSLDELPQIINVLLGNMSLVGPRPYLEREQIDMGKSYNIVTEVTPGITGLWQVSGRNELSFHQRLELDEYYVRNWSVWLDIMIIIKTAKVVLFRKGAY